MIDSALVWGYNILSICMHRLLSTVLSMKMTVDEKLRIMENEYHIPADDKLREDVSVMCILSQGIWEAGIAEGIEKGIAASEEKIIINMYRKGYISEQIADIVEQNISDVEEVIQKKEVLLV